MSVKSANAPAMRRERDSLGEVELPADALYGSNTQRALENFPFADRRLGEETSLVRAMAEIKQACAEANGVLGAIDAQQAEAIVAACGDMIAGRFDADLRVPLLEGSGGTSSNMNVNEVLANAALLRLGRSPGDYDYLHPNDQVNCGQSTNDVIPAAMKIAAYRLSQPVIDNLRALAVALERKSAEFSEVFRLGRTCLQDGQPMTLGQAFEGYHAVVARAAENMTRRQQALLALPLGGTAVGTGLGARPGFRARLFEALRDITGLEVEATQNRFDAMQNLDEFQRLSAELEVASAAMAKIAKDLILLSSGPAGGLAEIRLPAVQPGSSIMPGKVNPVMPMAMVQLAQIVHGNHACVVMVCQDGMLEINHYEHALASRLFDSLHRVAETTDVFTRRCIDGIEADAERSMANLKNSFALATCLVPKLGYSAVSALVKQSLRERRVFLDLLCEQGLLDPSEIDDLIREVVQPQD